MTNSETGKVRPVVVVVTGASRGAGRGIAVALGMKGATVYVTGRTIESGQASLPGTIHETADAVTAAGGKGIAVRVDHANDAGIQALFAQVAREQGHIDILVNNAAYLHNDLTLPGPFWEKSSAISGILDVGLRSQYVASYYAAPLLLRAEKGLVVFTSSFGASCYMHGPAYGAQKAGVDKFAADMAVDFKEHGVAAVSIWMGPLLTERLRAQVKSNPEAYSAYAEVAETPEFTGHVIAALHEDAELMSLSGQTLIGAELGERYGLLDSGGKQPPSYRQILGAPRTPNAAIVR